MEVKVRGIQVSGKNSLIQVSGKSGKNLTASSRLSEGYSGDP